MSKRKNTEKLEDQQEELLKAINELKETLNLDDEDMETIKDWGIAILVTGVSAFVIYQLIKRIFGQKEEEAQEDIPDSAQVADLLKQQLTLFLAGFAKKKLNKFLASKGLADED